MLGRSAHVRRQPNSKHDNEGSGRVPVPVLRQDLTGSPVASRWRGVPEMQAHLRCGARAGGPVSNCEQCGTPLRTYKLTAYSCQQEDPGDPRRDGNEHTVTRCRDALKMSATATAIAAARLCKAINDDDANGINDETLKATVDLRLLLSPSGAVNHLVDQSIPAPTNADVAMSDLRAMSDLMAEVDRLRA